MSQKCTSSEVVAIDQQIHQFMASDRYETQALPNFMFMLLEAAERDNDIVDSVLIENLDKLFIHLVTLVMCNGMSTISSRDIHSAICLGDSLKYYLRADVFNSNILTHWLGYLKIVDSVNARKLAPPK